jgi:hypothetical protein
LPLCAQKGLIEIFILSEYQVETEVSHRKLGRISTKFLAQRIIGEQALDGVGEFVLIIGMHEYSTLIVHQFGVAAHVVGNHGQMSGHGFENGIGQAFRFGREHGYIRGSQYSGNVVAFAKEYNRISDSKTRSILFQFVAERTISHENEIDIRRPVQDLSRNSQKSEVVFVVRIHPRHHANTKGFGAAGQRGRNKLKRNGWKGVSDDHELLARQTSSGKAICGSP